MQRLNKNYRDNICIINDSEERQHLRSSANTRDLWTLGQVQCWALYLKNAQPHQLNVLLIRHVEP
uniref:Uncharacterized protein n=1 Tax=Arion vulgaris TaxID=1028688 RepID=A0A0B6YR84_9EUPU